MFDIAGGTVIINHNCLSIPELKAIMDKYEDPIPVFNFLHFYFDLESPYANYAEKERQDLVMNDFPGDYTLEDDEVLAAMKKLEEMYITPTYRYYLDNKILMEKLGAFARNESITAGKDGNLSALSMQLGRVGKTILEFKQLEKVVKDELKEAQGRSRGDKKLAYDQ